MYTYVKSILRKILPAYRVACDIRVQVDGVTHEISGLREKQDNTNELICGIDKKCDEINEYLRGTLLYGGGYPMRIMVKIC